MATAILQNCILHVCITCRREGFAGEDETRPGAAMHAALSALPCADGVEIRPVECLSACSRGCAVALSAPGKWAYIYADLDPALHPEDILAGAARYALAPDGIPPWRERPEIFRKQVIARIPPLAAVNAPSESPQE